MIHEREGVCATQDIEFAVKPISEDLYKTFPLELREIIKENILGILFAEADKYLDCSIQRVDSYNMKQQKRHHAILKGMATIAFSSGVFTDMEVEITRRTLAMKYRFDCVNANC